MKRWFLLLLVAFIGVAGYKFSSYQHQLSESKAEKERLTSVLERSRATDTSDLKVIKAAPKLLANSADSKSTGLSDEPLYLSGPQLAANAEASAIEILLDSDIETSLTHFFANHPHSEDVVLEKIECLSGLCEVVGSYNKSEKELSELVNALQAEPWWQFTSPVLKTQLAQRGVKVNLTFSAKQASEDKVIAHSQPAVTAG